MNCRYCNKLAKSKISKQQHEIRCKLNPNQISMQYLTDRNILCNGKRKITPTPCEFCKKIYDSKISLGNHRIRCPENPNRSIQILTDAGRERIRQSTREQNKTQWLNESIKEKHRQSMRRAVEKNPEVYTSSNRGRTKQIIADGIKFQGQWEVDFYLWAKAEGLNPRRPTESFIYEWNGTRSYFPDFYLPTLDLYIEVKGYETDRDRSKWSQFPKNLFIIKEAEIKEIKRNNFRAGSLSSKASNS